MFRRGPDLIRSIMIILIFGLLLTAAAQAKGSEPDVAGRRPTMVVPAGSSRSEVIAFGRSVRVDGEVTGSVVTMAGDAYVTGGVARDVVVLGGTAVLMSSATVGGDVVVIGGSLQQAEGASIDGRTVSIELPRISSWPKKWSTLPFWSGNRFALPWTVNWDARVHKVLQLMTDLILGWLVLALVPGSISLMADAVGPNWVRFALIGFVGYSVAIVVIVLAGITIIGLPIAFLSALALALAHLLAQVTVSVFVGRRLLSRSPDQEVSRLLAFLVGATAMFVLSLVPVARFIGGLLAALVGLGAVVDTRCGSGRTFVPPQVQ